MIKKTVKNSDFAYSVGLTRALESLLLSDNEVERMLLAKNFNEAFKILNETDYSDNQEGIENTKDFQKIINSGLLEIKEVLEKACPDDRILNILWMEYDFHNIKTLLKAKLGNKSFEEIKNLLSPMGKIDINKLEQYIFDNTNSDWKLYPKTETYIKKRIKDVVKLFEKTQNPQVIDLFLDQKLLKIVWGKAVDSGSQFLQDYIKLYIDLHNIRLFFRMKATNKSFEMFEYGFLWNGTNSWNKMKDAYKDDLEKFPEFMSFSKYHKIVEEGYKHYKQENTLIFLEKEIENYLTQYIKKAKLVAFGPEPLIAYFLAKKNNALIIRMILINKLNTIDPEEIRKRLRKLYS